MRRSLAIATIGVCAFVTISVVWLNMTYYGTVNAIESISTINSKDELFVYISHGTSVLKERRWQILLKQKTSVLIIPEDLSDDLFVAHFRNGKLYKYDLKGFGYGGSAFVYQGHIYWGRGHLRGETGPTMWTWNETNFVPLSHSETEIIDEHVKYLGDSMQAQGWQEGSLVHGQMTCAIGSTEITINRVAPDSQDQVFLTVIQNGKTNNLETLLDLKNGYQQISQNEYEQLMEKKLNFTSQP
jgi:hypothetical protein